MLSRHRNVPHIQPPCNPDHPLEPQRRTTSTKREEQPNAGRTARDDRRIEGVLLNLGFKIDDSAISPMRIA